MEWPLRGTHKEFRLQQERVQSLFVQLLCPEDTGGTEQVLMGGLFSWGHQVAEALLVAARSTHVQGQGDIGASPAKVIEEEKEKGGQWRAEWTPGRGM